MFNFFHPRPVVDNRPVAVKIVRQEVPVAVDGKVLVVVPEKPATAPPEIWDGRTEK